MSRARKICDEINGFTLLKRLDEETLRAVERTAVKDCTPGDDEVRFVLQDSSAETSRVASMRRAFEERERDKDRSERGAANSSHWTGTGNHSLIWAPGWWGGSGNTKKLAFVERLTQQ